MRTIVRLAALLAVLLAAPAASAQDFKVVAHPDVPLDSASRSQVSDLFLKRTTTWPGGAKVDPVDLAEGSKTFEAFSTAVHGKAGSVIRAFWKKVTMSGRDTPPHVRGSDDEVLAYVRATRGAIGYVSAGAATSGVKVITVGN